MNTENARQIIQAKASLKRTPSRLFATDFASNPTRLYVTAEFAQTSSPASANMKANLVNVLHQCRTSPDLQGFYFQPTDPMGQYLHYEIFLDQLSCSNVLVGPLCMTLIDAPTDNIDNFVEAIVPSFNGIAPDDGLKASLRELIAIAMSYGSAASPANVTQFVLSQSPGELFFSVYAFGLGIEDGNQIYTISGKDSRQVALTQGQYVVTDSSAWETPSGEGFLNQLEVFSKYVTTLENP
jgi:hypothetical protein